MLFHLGLGSLETEMTLPMRKNILRGWAGFGLLALLMFVIVVFFLKTQQQVSQPPPTQQVEKPFNYNPEGFNTSQYIVPLGKGETGGESFFSAQLRGAVSFWKVELLTVNVGEDAIDIHVPEKLAFRCMPLTMTDSQGNTYDPRKVFVDFYQSPVKGTMIDRSVIAEKMTEGSDITVQVKYVDATSAEATFIVGYGCKI